MTNSWVNWESFSDGKERGGGFGMHILGFYTCYCFIIVTVLDDFN
jgi:hypothetical protein